MTQDYPGPAQGATYKGFAAPAPRDTALDAARRKKVLLAGIGAALALGLGFGLLARPELIGREQRPMAAVEQVPTPKGQLAIVVNKVAPPAPPKRTGDKLEVLPPELAAAAPRVEPTFRQAAAETVQDLAPPVFTRPAARESEEAPIDCSRPADREEFRICADIGYGGEDDYYRPSYGRY